MEDAHTGDVAVTSRLGIVSVEVNPRNVSTVVHAMGLGVMNTREGLALGYHQATLAAFPPGDCRVVLWIDERGQIEALERLLRERSDICVIGPNEQLRRKP